jgi:hypothetical protein
VPQSFAILKNCSVETLDVPFSLLLNLALGLRRSLWDSRGFVDQRAQVQVSKDLLNDGAVDLLLQSEAQERALKQMLLMSRGIPLPRVAIISMVSGVNSAGPA